MGCLGRVGVLWHRGEEKLGVQQGHRRSPGTIFGHAWSRRTTGSKKATQQIGPRRHQNIINTTAKNMQHRINALLNLVRRKNHTKQEKNPAARPNNTARNTTAKQQNQQTS